MRLNIGLVLLVSFFGLACRKGERITTDPNAKLNISDKEILFEQLNANR